jgi:hypothetical protein
VNRGPAVVLAVTAALVAAAGVALAAAGPDTVAGDRSAEFHQLVGGLGGGPAPVLSRCEGAFDPRLASDCTLDNGPVPCAESFCPYHGHASPD